MKFVTAILENRQTQSRKERFQILEKILSAIDDDTDVLVLPAGFLFFGFLNRFQLKRIEWKLRAILKKHNSKVTLCFGVDFGGSKHQLGFALNQNGIQAIGRKFFPTEGDTKDGILPAKSPDELEYGYERTFRLNGKKIFLAVCYDGFGIKHQNQGLEGIDYIVDMIHQFNPVGQGNSGEVYFAKHGLAGASKHCKCPVLASTVFIDREIPERWPSGVVWQSGDISTQKWKYEFNRTQPVSTKRIEGKKESIELRYFDL